MQKKLSTGLGLIFLLTGAFVFARPEAALADTIHLQPDFSKQVHTSQLTDNTGQTEQYYYGDTGTYNQIFWYQTQETGLPLPPTFEVFDGVATTSYQAMYQGTTTPSYGGSFPPNVYFSCIANVFASTTAVEITLNSSGSVRMNSNLAHVGNVGYILGDNTVYADSKGAFGFSHSDSCIIFDDYADLSTHVVQVYPQLDEVVATSTNFVLEALININSNEYFEHDDWFLRLKYVRNQDLQAAVANKDVLWTTIDIPITSWPNFEFLSATSSILETGRYTYVAEIRYPSVLSNVLGWWGLDYLVDNGLVARKQSSFVVVEPTALDDFISNMASSTEAIFGSPGDFSASLDSCNPLSGFDVRECLTGLLLPNDLQLENLITVLRANILTKAPQGYITRVVDILGAEATSSLPVINYEFGPESPLAGDNLTFDFNDTLASASVILNDTLVSNQDEPKSAMEIFMPFWNVVVYLVLLMMITHDLTNVFGHHHVKKRL